MISIRKLILFGVVFALFALAGTLHAQAQTSCTSSTGACAPLQIGGPVGSTATLYQCGGTCTAASLTAYLANPSTTSPWSVVGTFPQKAATVGYNAFEIYGSLTTFAATNTPAGGTAGAPALVTFQMPAAPQTPTTLTFGATPVTLGAPGPQ